MARYLLLHGFGGIGPDHWLVWLSTELRARGHVARIRKLPEPTAPDLDAWLTALTDRLTLLSGSGALGEQGDPSGELVVIAHSLGGRLWLHHAQEGQDGLALADRVALVAPPRLPPDRGEGNRFYDLDLARVDPARVARSTRVVISSDDRFWPDSGAVAGIADPLGLPVDHLGDCGHFEPQDGFGPWPGILAWAVGEADTITR